MNRLFSLAFAGLSLTLLSTDGARAQVSAPLVFDLPASTEAMGMGNAFQLAAGDADAVFYNPGALAGAGGTGVAVQRLATGARLLTGSGALSWLGGGVGVGVQALSYDAVGGAAPTHSDLESGGDLAVSEMAASVGYARSVGSVQLGAVAKLVEQRIGASTAATGAVDLGATVDVAFVTLGLAVQNLGPDVRLAEMDLAMPYRIALGGSFEPEPVGPLDVGAAASLSYRNDGELIAAGGVDIRYWPIQGRTLIARIGASNVPEGGAKPLTFGLAFWGDAIALEYAFRVYDGTDDAHRFGVRWRQ